MTREGIDGTLYGDWPGEIARPLRGGNAPVNGGRWVSALYEGLRKHVEHEAAKSDGQVAHEAFHGKLTELGVSTRGGWLPLAAERKAAWEVAAKAVRDKRKTEELRRWFGFDPGRDAGSALFVNNEPAKFCFPHSNEKPFVEFKSGLRMPLKGPVAINMPPKHSMSEAFARYLAPYMGGVQPDLIIIDECDTFRPSREQWIAARRRYGQMVHEILEQATKENNKMQQQDQIKALNAEVERLLEEKAEALEQVSDFRIDCDEQAARADRLTQEQVELRSKLAEVQGERDTAQYGRDAAQSARDSLDRTVRELRAELGTLKAKVNLTEQANADLLEMLDSILAERHVGQPPTFEFQRRQSFRGGLVDIEIHARRLRTQRVDNVRLTVHPQVPPFESIRDAQRRQARGY